MDNAVYLACCEYIEVHGWKDLGLHWSSQECRSASIGAMHFYSVSKETHHEFIDFPCDPRSRSSVFDERNLIFIIPRAKAKSKTVRRTRGDFDWKTRGELAEFTWFAWWVAISDLKWYELKIRMQLSMVCFFRNWVYVSTTIRPTYSGLIRVPISHRDAMQNRD